MCRWVIIATLTSLGSMPFCSRNCAEIACSGFMSML